MASERKDPAVRKQEIIESAIQLFLDQGYENTNVRDIAKNAGVTQGLLYHYFRSKEEMVVETAKFHINIFLDIMREAGFDRDMPPLAALELMMNSIFIYAQGNVDLMVKIHMKENKFLHDAITNVFIASFSGLLAHVICNGLERGLFHCEYPERTAGMLLYGVMDAVHTDYLATVEDVHKAIAEQKQYLLYCFARLLNVEKAIISPIFESFG